jgi:hypothetical protein
LIKLTSHLIELFTLDPVLIFLFIHLLKIIECFFLFLRFIKVFLFELRVQSIPSLGSLSQVHCWFKVINLVQLFLKLFLVLLQKNGVGCLRFLDNTSERLRFLVKILLCFLDKVIMSIDLIEINIFRHCLNL